MNHRTMKRIGAVLWFIFWGMVMVAYFYPAILIMATCAVVLMVCFGFSVYQDSEIRKFNSRMSEWKIAEMTMYPPEPPPSMGVTIISGPIRKRDDD